ncbi:SMP-30/gluconolactonase/LRE family protein [Planctomyces sp. SH-PL62]|uniref:SMP-30/gluconolactonase/LRE family protein n=1 Tax=Planctomyces sp. SH-PL62 TaxID=1636152 RepID=UPI00078C6A4C|nr:SMP-30/gluconolactonase/LRE family protein [Planctomyces sp. SH-PL62]AMV38840.1 enterobactin/ferric enterobactin esterase [Planctomyces sp. SH-PL62]
MMRRRSTRLHLASWTLLLGVIASGAASADEVPRGEVQKHEFAASSIFPGTTRDYWIYIPKQYDPSKPACLFVCQDGLQYDAPAVFDDLIAKGEIPVLIGVFVMHGRVKAPSDGALDRFNRSLEYDGLGDAYARFLTDELLPDVEKRQAADGRPIRLSKDGNDRAIGGSSSGAVCAFTAAWERPESFRRVFSAIGTYVGLRGGNDYPTLIRKYEPKPLRVFLEDGSNDLNIYGGDWWMANQEMERALTYAGYEVAHVWGDGGHSSKHATEIFPEAMRWLWKGWPAAVQAGSRSDKLQEVVIGGEGWTVAAEGVDAASIAVDPSGDVYVSDAAASRISRIGADGRVEPVADRPEAIVDALAGRITRNDGARFQLLPSADESPTGGRRIEARTPEGAAVISNTGIAGAESLVLSPDESLLYIADATSRWVYSFQVQPDLSLQFGQKYYHLHLPDDARDAGTSGLCVDRDGRLYAATTLGVQVCDQAGRVNVVIPTPGGAADAVTFGGPDFDVLYATSGNVVYKRRVKPHGVHGFTPPHKPVAPRL